VCPLGLLCTARANANETKGNGMAHDEEPLLADPPTQDVAVHVRDYTRFTKLLKWGAIISLAIAFLVLLILK
jgi:hypothetical protein